MLGSWIAIISGSRGAGRFIISYVAHFALTSLALLLFDALAEPTGISLTVVFVHAVVISSHSAKELVVIKSTLKRMISFISWFVRRL